MSSFFTSWLSSDTGKMPPAKSATNVPMKQSAEVVRGEDLIKRAVSAEERDPAEALRLYTDALAVWVEIMRVETNEDKKADLSRFISHYMQRAEVMKTIVNESKKVQSDFKNYSQPTASSTKKTAASSRRTAQSQPRLSRPHSYPPPTKQPIGRRQQPQPQQQRANSSKDNEYESQMLSEMLDTSPGVRWSDISGLDYAKRTIHEAVVLPNMRPDLFSGLRSPPKGVLFYGPPGTGKTMLAKAVATESGFNFFSISSSSVTSKFLGEGEKLMKAVFELARKKQPAVIFFDEIDALLSSRKDNEHEASRRLKTEFMVQLDGAASNASDRILIIGATNIPWELDEAVLRRLVKRIYVPLPEGETRSQLITHLLAKQDQASGASKKTNLSKQSLTNIVRRTEGYSASDITALCKEAAMAPIREIPPAQFATFKAENLRPICEADFVTAIQRVRPSVSGDSLGRFDQWSAKFGTQS